MILDDGFSTTVTIAGITMIEENTVTPPGADGGGEINNTSMRNTRWRTKKPKSLLDLTPLEMSVQYDPAFYDALAANLQVNQAITVEFSDGSTLVFWGWIDSITPNENSEGELPLADITIIPSNIDGAGAEIAPAHTAAA